MSKRPVPPTFTTGTSKKKKSVYSPWPTTYPFATAPTRFPSLKPHDAIVLLQGYFGWLRGGPTSGGGGSYCTFKHENNLVKCIMKMPINCPITAVESSGKFTAEKEAKQDAAYRAILALHGAGEFNDQLMPTPKAAKMPPPPGALKLCQDLTKQIFGGDKFSKANVSSTSSLESTMAKVKSDMTKSLSDEPASKTRNLDGSGLGKRPRADSDDGTERVPERGPESARQRTGANAIVVAAGAKGPPPTRPISHAEASRQRARDDLPPPIGPASYKYKRPAFWDEGPITHDAFAAPLSMTFPSEFKYRSGECRALLLVTAKPLPFGEEIEINTVEAEVKVRATLGRSFPMRFTSEQLDMTFEWTRLCMRAVMNQPLDCRFEDCGWLLLPLKPARAKATNDEVCWEEVRRVDIGPIHPLDPIRLSKHDLCDSVLSWPKEFSRRYYFKGIRRDLRPHSICPRDSRRTILELISSSKSRLKYADQDVIEATVAYSTKHNGFVGTFTTGWRDQHLVPELLRVHMLRAGVFKAATLLPQIITVLEENLLAVELSTFLFQGRLDRHLARSAIRAPTLGSNNYERLEWLGDSVLSFFVSVGVFHNATDEEVQDNKLAEKRHKMVSNRALAAAIVKSGVAPFIRRTAFTPLYWAPYGWVYDDCTPVSVPTKQKINDKGLADVGEALIGAAYLSSKREASTVLDAMHALGFSCPVESWDELPLSGSREGSPGNPWDVAVLGYKFWDLARGEAVVNLPPDEDLKVKYDRYSFLGFALLEYFTIDALWAAHPSLDPARLTVMKHSRVSCALRSALVGTSDIFDSVHLDETALSTAQAYRESVIAAQEAAEKSGDPDHEFWASSVTGNQLLGSFVTAALGAIFEDCNFDIEVVRKAYNSHILPFQDRYGAPAIKSSQHPKSLLINELRKLNCSSWRVEQSGGDEPGALCHAIVYVHGSAAGASTADTPQLASRRACDSAIKAGLDKLVQRVCSCR